MASHFNAGRQRPAGKVWRRGSPADRGCRRLCGAAGGPCSGRLLWFQGLCNVQVRIHPTEVSLELILAAMRATHIILHALLGQCITVKSIQ